MGNLIYIWLNVLVLWLLSDRPTPKAVLSAKINEAAMNNIRNEGVGGA